MRMEAVMADVCDCGLNLLGFEIAIDCVMPLWIDLRGGCDWRKGWIGDFDAWYLPNLHSSVCILFCVCGWNEEYQ